MVWPNIKITLCASDLLQKWIWGSDYVRCMCDQSESEHFCFAFGQRPSLLPGWENAQKNGGIDIMIMINDSMGMRWRTRTGGSNPDARLWLITHCFLSRNSALICGPIPPFFIICWPILTFFPTGTILYNRTAYNAIPWHSTPYNHTKQCHFIPYITILYPTVPYNPIPNHERLLCQDQP